MCVQKFIGNKFTTTSQVTIAEAIYNDLVLHADNVILEYKKYNLLEKGIFFYYISYIIAFRDKLSVKLIDFKAVRCLLDKFYDSLSV